MKKNKVPWCAKPQKHDYPAAESYLSLLMRPREALIILKEPLSPLLLCRDPGHGKLVIADGYHRLCAVYSVDEDAMIPCQIA